MNLYDAYLTSCDRESRATGALEALSPIRRAPQPPAPQPAPSPAPVSPSRPMPDAGVHACGAGFPSHAMVYSPLQCFRMMYSPEEALRRGTLFRELDKPFSKGGGAR